MIADRAFDADRLRRGIEARGAVPNIPPNANRRWKSCFSPTLYRSRNAFERTFYRLKDFRRVATRYDRLAPIYLAAVHIAAIVALWLWVRTLVQRLSDQQNSAMLSLDGLKGAI